MSTMRNIGETLSLGPELFAGHRVTNKAQNLEQDELKLHRTVSREGLAIFKDKKFLLWRELGKLTGYVDESIFNEMIVGFDIELLLWRELCKPTGYGDESIFDEMFAGFDIVGTGPTLPAVPSQLVPATLAVQDLERHIHWLRLRCG
jgi:hypothetical protein